MEVYSYCILYSVRPRGHHCAMWSLLLPLLLPHTMGREAGCSRSWYLFNYGLLYIVYRIHYLVYCMVCMCVSVRPYLRSGTTTTLRRALRSFSLPLNTYIYVLHMKNYIPYIVYCIFDTHASIQHHASNTKVATQHGGHGNISFLTLALSFCLSLCMYAVGLWFFMKYCLGCISEYVQHLVRDSATDNTHAWVGRTRVSFSLSPSLCLHYKWLQMDNRFLILYRFNANPYKIHPGNTTCVTITTPIARRVWGYLFSLCLSLCICVIHG